MGRALNQKQIDVLLVEDNEGDVILVRQALMNIGASLKLHVATDGIEAMSFLKQSPKPSLVILDLNLPRKSGQQVLEELKADPSLRDIPVVVFSSSRALQDVRNAYRLQASSYVRKPEDVDEFFQAVAGLEKYWTETVTLP